MSVKQLEARAAVTVSEMAELVELSRARFYELIGTAFPHPVYDVITRRPLYDHELRDSCLEVRRTGRGVDGRLVLFNRKRQTNSVNKTPGPVKQPNVQKNVVPAEILKGLRALGLGSIQPDQVRMAIDQLFPDGTESVDQGEVIRQVFVFLMKK
jgi:hypothetical protein